MVFTTSKVRNIKSTKCAGADPGVKYGPCKKKYKNNWGWPGPQKREFFRVVFHPGRFAGPYLDNPHEWIEENKHNPKYLFNTVAKLTKSITSAGADITQQHSSDDFMNYFTAKIKTIRDKIVTTHQIHRSPEEQFHSFSSIGNEELYKLVKSSKPSKSSKHLRS